MQNLMIPRKGNEKS